MLLLISGASLLSIFCSLATLLGPFNCFVLLMHILLMYFLWNVRMWPLREMIHHMAFLVLLPLVDDLFIFLHLDPILIDKLLKLIVLFPKFVLVFVLHISLMSELVLEIVSRLLLFLVCILQLFVQFVHRVLGKVKLICFLQ